MRTILDWRPRGTDRSIMAERSGADGGSGSFKRARNLLLGAVDIVLQIAREESTSATTSQRIRSEESASTSASTSQQREENTSATSFSGNTQGSRISAGLSEHRRLFGFQPSKLGSKGGSKKGKGKLGGSGRLKPGRSTWRKECICLRDRQQGSKPSAEEKMELARMGLGLAEVVFNADGDAEHIHSMLTKKFPVLDSCRLGENSRALVEIKGPDSGLTVRYLKDILNQAKLYIRPLQSDISEEDMKPYRASEVS